MASEGGQDMTQVFNVDADQLAQLLSANGTAQLVDEHGNTITITAEQFAEAGFSLGSASQENQETVNNNMMLQHGQYVQGEDGQIYLVQQETGHEGSATEAFILKHGDQNKETDVAVAAPKQVALDTGTEALESGFLPFPCDQCPRRFAQETHLKRHLEVAHANKKPFYCHFCQRDLYVASEAHFQAHLRMQHKADMLKAAQRDQKYVDDDEDHNEQEPDWEMLYKQQTDTMGGDFKCNICQQMYPTINGLKLHAKESHGVELEGVIDQRAFHCSLCSKAFSRQEFLDRHKLAHVDLKPYSCQYCPEKSFKWKENLLRHLSKHMERMPFKCAFCNQGFASQIRLDMHQKTRHGHSREATGGLPPALPNQQREHACPICQKTFVDKDIMSKHMRIHGGTVFPCPECDKKFINEKFLRNHMTVHTQIRDFTCEKCGKFFNSASMLKAHRYVHGERPYKCRACRRTFRRLYDLKSHEKMHTELKSHKCTECGRTFRHKANLDLHMKVHRGMKPFQCSSCKKTFGKLQHLQMHVQAHKGVKPFACQKCDKAFFSENYLKQHQLLHQGKVPFECGVCQRAFSIRNALLKHLKRHTTKADVQYVVFWEKGGTLKEATIVTDGNLANEDYVAASKPIVQQQQRQIQDDERFIKAHAKATMNDESRSLDQPPKLTAQQKEHVPEKPAEAEATTLKTADRSAPMTAADQEQAVGAMIDPNTLLALAEAQGEDGTIYISEENLQALARQGVVFTYE